MGIPKKSLKSTKLELLVSVSAVVGWRGSWILAAITLACFTAPVLMYLLLRERTPQSIAASQEATGLGGRHWQRRDAMRHWLMWALLPGIMAPSFMITSLFFHQVHVTEIKGWSLAGYVTVYPLYSIVIVSCNMIAGILIDRFGSAKLLPVYLLPIAIAFALYGSFDGFWVAPVGLTFAAIGQGAGQGLMGSLWPEYYGTRHLGAIRSLVIAFTVAASAIGPGITGLLIDLGVGFETQCLFLALYLVVMSGIFVFVARSAAQMKAAADAANGID